MLSNDATLLYGAAIFIAAIENGMLVTQYFSLLANVSVVYIAFTASVRLLGHHI